MRFEQSPALNHIYVVMKALSTFIDAKIWMLTYESERKSLENILKLVVRSEYGENDTVSFLKNPNGQACIPKKSKKSTA